MMFDLDEDNYDESKIEEIELNWPWTLTGPLGANHNFVTKKPRWSFQRPFWLTVNFYPVDKPAHPIGLDKKMKTLVFAKTLHLFDCL